MNEAEQSSKRRLMFVPYSPEMDERIVEFNRRLAEGRAESPFRLRVGPGTLLFAPDEESVWEERYLALEGEAVRGGIVLQVQPFHVEGEIFTVANIQLPLSEGIVDRRYAYLGMWLIKHVLRRYPRCYALGIGAEDRPLSLLLRGMGFAVWSVPFYFMLANVSRAVRELPALGSPARRRFASTFLRATGVGALASRRWRAKATRSRGAHATSRSIASRNGGPGPTRSGTKPAPRSRSPLCVTHARCTALFPTGDPQFPALRLDQGGQTLGWVVVGLRRMVDSPHFGSLNVGDDRGRAHGPGAGSRCRARRDTVLARSRGGRGGHEPVAPGMARRLPSQRFPRARARITSSRPLRRSLPPAWTSPRTVCNSHAATGTAASIFNPRRWPDETRPGRRGARRYSASCSKESSSPSSSGENSSSNSSSIDGDEGRIGERVPCFDGLRGGACSISSGGRSGNTEAKHCRSRMRGRQPRAYS